MLLLDKEAAVGFHTSGRNSGVVHSGFNPKPGTLKARLCVEGSRLIRQYCKDRGIPCEQVGTYVVAVDGAQAPVLEELKRKGEKNGVPGIEILPIERVREREPNVKCVAAMYSPTGAIVDSQALTRALADDAVKAEAGNAYLKIVESIAKKQHNDAVAALKKCLELTQDVATRAKAKRLLDRYEPVKRR